MNEIVRLKDLIKDNKTDVYDNAGLAQTCSDHLVKQQKELKQLEQEKTVRRRTSFPPMNTNPDINVNVESLTKARTLFDTVVHR